MVSSSSHMFFAFLAGILVHKTYFSRGEHDLQAANIARLHMLLAAIVSYYRHQVSNLTWSQSNWDASLISVAYASGIFSSIIVFRLFFSPLHNIPGPLRMKVSKLVHVWDILDPTRQNYKALHKLRAEYGDIVRTGPNEVTLFNYDAYNQIHGPESSCRRAAYYDILHPLVSLDTTRDPIIHAKRRRLWDQPFSMKALEKSQSIIYGYADVLIDQLRQREGSVIDITIWIEYYCFDLMGALGLDIQFKNLTEGEHPILGIWHIAHKKLGAMNVAPWIKHLLMGIPFIERMKYYRQFMDWAHNELETNINNNKEDRQNVIGHVLSDALANGGVKKNWNFVLGDFVLVIAAGSDPVRQTVSFLFYYLAQNPEHLKKIREELQSIDIKDYKALQHAEHLNACIFETLRLYPAVPSAGLRMPPKGGMHINGIFLPEDTTIVTPQYSVMRDERSFVDPNEWIPERFTTRPELILNKQAFVPWSMGKMSCLGKNLSLMECRIVSALVLTHFDCDLAPGETGEKVFLEATDYFTTTPGPLNVVLRHRG